MTAPNTERLKNIQAVITRLAQNSFTIKGWSVALVTGVLGFAAKDGSPTLAWVAVYIIVVFGVLDAYYLALERKFRALYDKAIWEPDTVWDMNPGPTTIRDVFGALRRPAVWIVQLAALVATIAVALTTAPTS